MKKMTQESDDIIWTIHLAYQNKGKAVMGLICILLLSSVIYYEFDDLFWSFFSVLILFFSLRHFYFPIHYYISSTGISRKTILKNSYIKWSEIKRFIKFDKGAIIYTRKNKSFADSFTGLEVRCKGNDEEIMNQIENLILSSK